LHTVCGLNSEVFAETFFVPGQGTNAEQTAVLLMQAITVACNASMLQRRGFKRHHQPVYWWNEDIAEARRRCISARRLLQRFRGRPDFEARRLEYGIRRRVMKKAIRQSKLERFLEPYDEAASTIGESKAPGPDAIPNRALKLA